MAFDNNKDKILKAWEITGENDILRVGVYSYNGNEAKLQIGPRVVIKKDGSDGFRKAGRLTLEEVRVLKDLMADIEATLVKADAE